MQHRLNWDSLRFFLAAAREGNLSAAARKLRVNRSTVLRRVREFEKDLGVKLFESTNHGFFLSDAGEELMHTAVRIEDEMNSLRRHLDEREHEMTGTVRITSTLPLGFGLLQPYLRKFRDIYPGVSIELMATLDGTRSVSRHEADVAFRTVVNPKDEMEGERLCDVAVSIYGSKDYVKRNKLPTRVEELREHHMIGMEGALGQFEFIDRSNDRATGDIFPYRTNTLMFHLAAARAGIGLASLPCYLADPESALVRVFPKFRKVPTELWLMTHPGMKRLARIRILMDFMRDSILQDKAMLEGQST